MCVYYMTGTPEGSTESGFMEKPGIKPTTPGLQGIALIHYTKSSCSRLTASLSYSMPLMSNFHILKDFCFYSTVVNNA